MAQLNKKIVWQRPDGGISITHLDDLDKLDGESDDDFIVRYTDRLKLDPFLSGSSVTVADESQIPSDDSQRNEWSLIGKNVEVDPVKVAAKEDKITEVNAIYSKLGITKEEFEKISVNES